MLLNKQIAIGLDSAYAAIEKSVSVVIDFDHDSAAFFLALNSATKSVIIEQGEGLHSRLPPYSSTLLNNDLVSKEFSPSDIETYDKQLLRTHTKNVIKHKAIQGVLDVFQGRGSHVLEQVISDLKALDVSAYTKKNELLAILVSFKEQYGVVVRSLPRSPIERPMAKSFTMPRTPTSIPLRIVVNMPDDHIGRLTAHAQTTTPIQAQKERPKPSPLVENSRPARVETSSTVKNLSRSLTSPSISSVNPNIGDALVRLNNDFLALRKDDDLKKQLKDEKGLAKSVHHSAVEMGDKLVEMISRKWVSSSKVDYEADLPLTEVTKLELVQLKDRLFAIRLYGVAIAKGVMQPGDLVLSSHAEKAQLCCQYFYSKHALKEQPVEKMFEPYGNWVRNGADYEEAIKVAFGSVASPVPVDKKETPQKLNRRLTFKV